MYKAILRKVDQWELTLSFTLLRIHNLSWLQCRPKEAFLLENRLTYSLYSISHLFFQFLNNSITTLFNMGIDASKLRVCFYYFFFVFKFQMVILTVQIFLTATKVNHKYFILLLPKSR